MKKIIFLIFIFFSLQILADVKCEGKYADAAKKATNLTNEELKIKTSELFKGIDINKISEESGNKTDEHFGIDEYKRDMCVLLNNLKIDNLCEQIEILYIQKKICYADKIYLQNSLIELKK